MSWFSSPFSKSIPNQQEVLTLKSRISDLEMQLMQEKEAHARTCSEIVASLQKNLEDQSLKLSCVFDWIRDLGNKSGLDAHAQQSLKPTAHLNELNTTLESLTIALDQQTLAQLQKLDFQLKSQQAQLELQNEEMDDVNEELARCRQDVHAKESELLKLCGQLEELGSLKENESTLKSQLISLEHQLQSQSEQVMQIPALEVRLSEILSRNAQLEEQLTKISHDFTCSRDAFEQQIQNANEQIESLEAHRTQSKVYLARMEESERFHDVVKQSLKDVIRSIRSNAIPTADDPDFETLVQILKDLWSLVLKDLDLARVQIASKSSKIKRLEARMSNSKMMFSMLEELLKNSRVELETAKAQFRSSSIEIQEQFQRVQDQAIAKLNQSHSHTLALQQECDAFSIELETNRDMLENLQKTHAHEKNRMAGLQTELESASSTISVERARVVELQSQLLKVSEQSHEKEVASQRLLDDASNEMARLRDVAKDATFNLELLEFAKLEAEVEKERLSNAVKAKDELLSEARTSVHTFESKCKSMAQDLKDITASLSSDSFVDYFVAQMNPGFCHLHSLLDILVSRFEPMTVHIQALEVFKSQAENRILEIQATLELRDGELDDAFAKISELEATLQDKDMTLDSMELLAERDSLLETLASKSREIDSLSASLQDMNSISKVLECQVETITAETVSLKGMYEQQTSEIQAQLEKVTAEREMIIKQAQDQSSQMFTLQESTSHQIDEITRLRESELRGMETERSEYFAFKRGLEKELKDASDARDSLLLQLEDSQQQFTLLTAKLVEIESENTALSGSLLSHKEQHAQALSQLTQQISSDELNAHSQITKALRLVLDKIGPNAKMVEDVAIQETNEHALLDQILSCLDSQAFAFKKLEQASLDKDLALTSMEMERNSKNADYQCLQERNSELEIQLNQTLGALTMEQDALVESLEKIKDLKDTLGLLESNVVHLKSQVEAKEILIVEAQARLTEMDNSARVSLEEERKTKNADISNISSNLDLVSVELEKAKNELLEKEQLILTLNAELAIHLSTKENNANPNQDEQSAIQAQITSLEEQVKLKSSIITGFEQALLQAQEYMDEKESLAAQKEAEVLTLKDALSRNQAQLENQMTELSETKSQLLSLQSSYSKLEESVDGLKSDLQDRISAMEASLVSKNAEVLNLTSELEESKSTLNSTFEDIRCTTDSNQALCQQVAQLELDNETLQTEMNAIKSRLEISQSERDSLHIQLKETLNSSAKPTLSNAYTETITLEPRSAQIDAFTETMESDSYDDTGIGNTILSLQEKSKSLVIERDELDCRLKVSQKELDQLYQRIAEQEIQIRQWKLDLEKAQACRPQDSNLSEQIVIYQDQVQELQIQIAKFEAKCVALEKDAQDTLTLNDGLNEKYISIMKRNKKLEAVVLKLHKQLEGHKKSSLEQDLENVESPQALTHSASLSQGSATNSVTPRQSKPIKRTLSEMNAAANATISPLDRGQVIKESLATSTKPARTQSNRNPSEATRKMRRVLVEPTKDGKPECNQQ